MVQHERKTTPTSLLIGAIIVGGLITFLISRHTAPKGRELKHET